VEDLIKTKIAKLGENISVARFTRSKSAESKVALGRAATARSTSESSQISGEV
jgi:translation elongation factor EF-Ts